MRIGYGWDLHRLEEERKLLLGGVEIPFPKGEAGHSDGDVVLHALMDAVLGASALTDIGDLFPDDDPEWRGADSSLLTEEVIRRAAEAGLRPHNVDLTIVLQAPEIAPHREKIRASIARLTGLGVDRVGIKAKTSEGLGDIGAGVAVACHAVVLMEEGSE